MYDLNLLKPIKSVKTMNLLLNYFLCLKFEMSNSSLDYIKSKINNSLFFKYNVIPNQKKYKKDNFSSLNIINPSKQ